MENGIENINDVRPNSFLTIEGKKENLIRDRIGIINTVNEFIGDGGCVGPITEVMQLYSDFFRVCAEIEDVAKKVKYDGAADDCDKCFERNQVMKEAAYVLPTFDALNRTTFALKELFKFLMEINDYSERAERWENEILLLQGRTVGDSHWQQKYIETVESLSKAQETLADHQRTYGKNPAE